MSGNLIIGGFGFLGCHIVRELLRCGEEVTVFARSTVPPSAADIAQRVRYIRGDLTNWLQLVEAVLSLRPQTVFHFSAILPPCAEEQLYLTYRVNVQGTLNVLEAVRLAGVSCLVFVSSIAVYKPGVPLVVDDDFPQRPQSMYGTTKVCCERLGEQYNRRYGVNFRALRFPPVIGAGRIGEPRSSFTFHAIEAAAQLSPYTINVKPETKLPLLYVKDAARALISIRDAPEDNLRQRVYNLHGFSTSAADLVQAIKKHIPGAQLDFSPDEKIVRAINGWPERIDDSAARADWGWHATYDLEGTVSDFIAELRAHPERYAQPSEGMPSQ